MATITAAIASITSIAIGTGITVTERAAGGGWAARVQSAHEREERVERYIASIDPHARAGTTGAGHAQ